MSDNAELIHRFYQAFQQRDAAAMAACYHPQAHFSDPAFPDLHGAEVCAMWDMLCARGKDLTLVYSDVVADATAGRAHWQADYSFSQTGRKVHNVIDASFRFRDGLIVEHIDHFNFAKWAAQSLGFMGSLLGGTEWLQRKVQAKAAAGLLDWQQRAK